MRLLTKLFEQIFENVLKFRNGTDNLMLTVDLFIQHIQLLIYDTKIDLTPEQKNTSEVFDKEFIPKFLEYSLEYYQKFASDNLNENSSFEYLKLFKKFFDDEISMVQKYIHPDLCSNVQSDLENIFYDEFLRKITEGNIFDTRFIYAILSTRDTTVKELNNIFTEYLKIYLHDQINALTSSKNFVKLRKFQPQDSIIFMSELFDIFTKLDNFINLVFSSNPIFDDSKNLAIIYAINNCHDDLRNRGLQNIMAKYLHDALTKNKDFISTMHSQNHFIAFLRVLDLLEHLTTFTSSHLNYLVMRQAQNICTLSIEKEIIKLFDSKIDEKLTIEINDRFLDLKKSSEQNNLFFSSHRNSNNLKFNFLMLKSTLWNYTHYCDISQPREVEY
ncbi:hypothetical protein HZS_5381 [Henneguya salminicola]|nr:hypothetical protein HZS_5381 [Henneguya salminicola]